MDMFFRVMFYIFFIVYVGAITILFIGSFNSTVRSKTVLFIRYIRRIIRSKRAKDLTQKTQKVTQELWFLTLETLFEPLFWPFALFVVFEHFGPIFDKWFKSPNEIDIGNSLLIEMNEFPILYMIFFTLLFIFAVYRLGKNVREQDKNEEASIEVVESNDKVIEKLDDISRQLKELTDKYSN